MHRRLLLPFAPLPLLRSSSVLHFHLGLLLQCRISRPMGKKRAMEANQGEPSKQRKQLSLRTSNARAERSISYIQIFGSGMDTADTVPSVLLFFDSKRYIFNAGEGLQRFCQDNRIKISKMDHVLLTRVCSETAGGLAGALLTLAGDVGLTINIWGPSDLQHLATAMNTFLPNASVLYTHSFGSDGKLVSGEGANAGIGTVLEDELVKISAVLLVPDHGAGKAGDVAVVYACELPEVLGRFDPAKAVELGLKPGPKYAQLQKGCSVLSDDNKKEIFPGDVIGPSSPGPAIIVVDCPTIAHVASLVTSSGLERVYGKHENGKAVNCVVHLTPAAVVSDPRYRDWMRKLEPTQHILAGRGCSKVASPVLRSSASILFKLHYACPDVFPVSRFALEERNQSPFELPSDASAIPAENLLKFRLRPLSALGLDSSCIPELLTRSMIEKQLVEKVPEISGACKALKELWRSLRERPGPRLVEEPWLDEKEQFSADGTSNYMQSVPEALKGVGRNEMELVFLGTGSSQPSTYRNVSAIYVHCFERGGMLMDCGEGTYAQLIRRYGVEGAVSVLKGLRCVWISHIHADHHGGLARVLSMRRSVLLAERGEAEPLLVVGPKLLKRVLEAYDNFEDLAVDFLDCSQTTTEAAELASTNGRSGSSGFISSSLSTSAGKQMQNYWLHRGFHLRNGVDEPGRRKLKAAMDSLGLETLISVPVVHCPHAFAVVIESQSKSEPARPGWKLAYSGDTRPCEEFIRASQGATVFIHEATFEDSMLEEAVSKKHSCTGEAIRSGVAAQAYRIILTHFSQRYSKVPVFDESYNDSTCIAFDLMSVNLADLPILPSLIPVLKLLFQDEQPEETAAAGDDEGTS